MEATRAYHKELGRKAKTISLIDTFQDEKFEALRVAESFGRQLYGVRLDTPGSRRGDFLNILEEVRWELDLRGHKHVKLFVSGGLDEKDIVKLNPLVDGYGLGTSVSNARVIDFSMDIVEVEGKPMAKKGKASGSKRVLRCTKCYGDKVVPLAENLKRCACGGTYQDMLVDLIVKGKVKEKLPSPQTIRRYVLEELEHVPV